MSLNDLNSVQFCETDASAVEAEVITTYEKIAEQKLYPGDPVRLFLESLAYLIVQQRFLIDWSAKQNLLYYADGDHLDHLGALLDTSRLEPSAAKATLRFSISEPLAFPVPIPADIRATPDGKLMFATSELAEIPAGETSVDVVATCATTGARANGYVAGQIDRLVDPVAYVSAVRNVTMSSGGADIETDDNYRERVHLAPERFSVAGPRGAYEYWARTAHQDIVDVACHSPAPGEVKIHPLMQDAEPPSAELLQAVHEICDDERIRPLTDRVEVLPPEVVPYDLSITWYLSRENAALASTVQAAVAKAVAAFTLWQRSSLGRDINPSQLVARIMEAGAKRVDVASPAFQVLDAWQVGVAQSVTVTYGGVEER